MHDKTSNTIKHIIIADELKGDIKLPDIEFPIIYTNNIETVDTIIHKSDMDVLFAIFIIPSKMYGKIREHLNRVNDSKIYYQLIIIGSDDDIAVNDFSHLYYISDILPKNVSEKKLKFVIHKSQSIIEELFQQKQKQTLYLNKLEDSLRDQNDLIDIGRSLSGERDMDKLLRLILFLSKKITGADAGSIYLVEEDESGKKRLRFKYSHTFSRDIKLEEFVMDIDQKSVSGYVAVTGEVLNIPNAYEIPSSAPYSFKKTFDEQHSYQSRSMLVVPMRNHLNQIIGVMQLLNSKEDLSGQKYDNAAFEIRLNEAEDFGKYVVPFDERYNRLLEAIAGQAAISIENNRLITQIEMQFEEFVKASVTAIESRDPATSGHSFRVANICKKIAYAINESNSGYFKDFHFTDDDIKELEFAALLHDFGKVYIDLNIFKKSKKLYPKDLDNLKLRFDYLYRCIELTYFMKEMDILKNAVTANKPCDDELNKLRLEKESKLERVLAIKDELVKLNEPSVLAAEPQDILNKVVNEIEALHCLDITGHEMHILTENDKINLAIKRGSLNSEERLEIESHVLETYKFVSKIPWPPEYRKIPEIAMHHHEKLDGTGYPDGLKGKETTPIQSRIMAIADIYDALTAHDRSYKDSVPIDKVKKILREEAANNKIDADVVDIFLQSLEADMSKDAPVH